jgi:BON domain-containing protein
MTGGYPGGTTGRGAQIGATSFLGPYYANPLAMGLVSGTTSTTTRTAAFGQPLYTVTTSTTTSRGTANVATPGANGSFGAGYNVRRLPSYATRLAIKDMPPPPSAGQVQAELQTMLAQSSQLDQRDAVRVAIDGPVVVLQGRVADDDERRLVENMVRLTQGVGEVRNELTTMTSAATTARGP